MDRVARGRPPEQRPSDRAACAASIVLAVLFIPLGVVKLAGGDTMQTLFSGWGYSMWFLYFIGLWELLAGILVLAPRLAAYGSGLIVVEMIGAALTHVLHDEWHLLFAPAAVGVLALFVLWARIDEAAGFPARTSRSVRTP